MPEIYGEYDGRDGEGGDDAQYVGCVNCGELVDIFEAHPMFQEETVSETGDVVTRTYHFCSDTCLQSWKRERDIGE